MALMIKLYSRFFLFSTLSLSLLISSGCGGSGFNKIKGKVSFADGSPLTVGKIVAESPEHRVTATGYIKPDGTFEMGTATSNDGVPPGTWQIAIVGAVEQPIVYPDRPNLNAGKVKQLIKDTYANKNTSGITFKVPEQVTWEISVQAP
jgi:hypothetical protein